MLSANDEEDPADIAEWASFDLIYALAVFSFADARPRGVLNGRVETAHDGLCHDLANNHAAGLSMWPKSIHDIYVYGVISPALPDRANGHAYLHQLYTTAKPDSSGRVTVPKLGDTAIHTIVSN